MKKIDLMLNIDPDNTGYNNLKKLQKALEGFAQVLDLVEIIIKDISDRWGEFSNKFNESVKATEKFSKSMKEMETSGGKVCEVLKILNERLDELTKKLEKIK